MAVKAEILGEGPGVARIRLSGINAPAGDCAILIQRNQSPDSYLGLTGKWQVSPECWHPLEAREMAVVPGGVEFLVGQGLVDPILTVMAQNAFRLTLRSAAGTTAMILSPSMQHPLLASTARHEIGAEVAPEPAPPRIEPITPVEKPAPQPAVQQAPRSMTVDPADRLQPSGAERADREIRPTVERKSRKGLLIACAVAAILLAGGAAAAYLYVKSQNHQTGQQADQAGSPTTTAPQSTRELLQAFMKDNPDAAAIVDKADKMKGDGNIDAAVYLYRQGVDRGDARSALQLGILYDPAETIAATNSLAKSSDTAAFWYGKAADAGLPEAQRRLGMLLTKGRPADSSDFKNGVSLLQAASKQGDAEASTKLKELGQ